MGPDPLSVHMAAIALVNGPAGVLMVESRYPGMPDTFWALPGGMFEPDEAIEQALAREVLEETGLHINGPSSICGDLARHVRGRA